MPAKSKTPHPVRPPGFECTAVVIPAYNESRFIGSVVIQARHYASKVIVVDDGSKDDTVEIAKTAGAIVVQNAKNAGYGKTLATGFDYARNLKDVDVIVSIDGDGQHTCSEIPSVVQPILDGDADLVVGSRFLGKKSDIPRWRVFGQQALTIATNLSSRSTLTDSQSGFRAYSRKTLDVLTFDSTDMTISSEIQFMIQRAGLRVVEVPITVIYEEPAKRNPIMHGLQVLNGILRLVSSYRPLLFFGGGGLIILLGGLAWGGYVVNIYIRSQTLAIGYTLISVLLSILGASSLFTGLLLHNLSALMRDIKKTIEHIQPRS